MIAVKHQFYIGTPKRRDQINHIFNIAYMISRHIKLINRLNQNGQPMWHGMAGGIGQIFAITLMRFLARITLTSHDMNRTGVNCRGIGNGLVNIAAGLCHARGQGRQTKFASQAVAAPRIDAQH